MEGASTQSAGRAGSCVTGLPEASFAEREQAIIEITTEVQKRDTERELQSLADGVADEVNVNSKTYKRHQTGTIQHYSLAGRSSSCGARTEKLGYETAQPSCHSMASRWPRAIRRAAVLSEAVLSEQSACRSIGRVSTLVARECRSMPRAATCSAPRKRGAPTVLASRVGGVRQRTSRESKRRSRKRAWSS